MHHARWMAKVIYSLKIYPFRKQFKAINRAEIRSLTDICIFIVKIYAKIWFTAPLAVKALYSDFTLLKKLQAYSEIDATISTAIMKKFVNHLWYLSEELVAFSFFDSDIPLGSREQMRVQMFKVYYENEEEEVDDEVEEENQTPLVNHTDKYLNRRKFSLKISEVEMICEKDTEQFIGPSTKNFFERFNINTSFLSKTVTEWEDDENYRRGYEIVSLIRVVNDTAERAVKLTQGYNLKICNDEEQKQFLIQGVAGYQKKYPDSNKSTLTR